MGFQLPGDEKGAESGESSGIPIVCFWRPSWWDSSRRSVLRGGEEGGGGPNRHSQQASIGWTESGSWLEGETIFSRHELAAFGAL